LFTLPLCVLESKAPSGPHFFFSYLDREKFRRTKICTVEKDREELRTTKMRREGQDRTGQDDEDYERRE